MSFLETLRNAEIGKEAVLAAKMKEAENQGATNYQRGLARLAAEQAYRDTVASPSAGVNKGLTEANITNVPVSVNGINFLPNPNPAGLAGKY